MITVMMVVSPIVGAVVHLAPCTSELVSQIVMHPSDFA